LELAGGAVAVLSASRVSRAGSRRLRLVGPEGYFSLDLGARTAERVRWAEGDLGGEVLAVPEGDAIERMHDAFLAAVRGEGPFPVPATDALRAVDLADRVAAAVAAR
jgi:hypothetical protein